MEGAISQSISRIIESSASSVEYPFDILQQELSSTVLSSFFDNKKSPKQLCEEVLDKYKDVWFHGLSFLRNVLLVSDSLRRADAPKDSHLKRIHSRMEENGISHQVAIERVFLLLEKIKRPTPQLLELDALCGSWTDKKQSSFRIQFKNCWTELLRCCGSSMAREMLVKLLRIVPDSVMPFIANPEIFAGFFTECFRGDKDLEVSLLAVSGLFHLISKHNLGEPSDLYSRLYILISPSSMRRNGQSNRVFQLLVKALRSPLMPSQYVGLFAKKLLRVAVLVESPSMALWLLVSAFNLMQAHPIVSKPLLHRGCDDAMPSADPFDLDCCCIDEMMRISDKTSLWEIEVLLQHTDPSIVRMASLLKTNFFSRKAKTVSNDDYLHITDEQLFNRERKYGSHTKQKKSRGEVGLEGMIGEEISKDDVQISLAVPLGSGATQKPFDSEFMASFKRAYPVI